MEKRPRGNPNWTKGRSGNPSGKPKKQERRDGWINAASGHGTLRDRRLLTSYGVDVVTDLEARLLWGSEWLARRIIEQLPGDANRRGWALKTEDKDIAEAIQARAEELDLDGAMTRAAEYERAYGGGAIFPAIEGAQGDLSTELNPNSIATITALHVLEAAELYPVAWYDDIASPKWRLPSKYRITPLTGRTARALAYLEIHETRLILFPGRCISLQTQPGQREGWGYSELNHARNMIADAGLTWGSVATLLHEFGQGVYAIDGLADMLAQKDGVEQLNRRIDAMDIFKSTMRSTAIDAKDTYTRMATPASGLDGLLAQQKEWLAAVAGMPVPVLFGQQLGGMQSTGDAEIRTWYSHVEKVDAIHYNPRREQLVKLLLLETTGVTGGKEPDLWSVEPKPLWSPTEKEIAETRLIDATTDEKNIANGVYTADDAANSRYGGDTYGRDIVIDWTARDAQKKAEEAMAEEQRQAELTAMPPPAAEPNPADTAAPQPRADMIEHRGDKWVVLSHDGGKVLGTHDTEEEAKRQLRAVEAHKHGY